MLNIFICLRSKIIIFLSIIMLSGCAVNSKFEPKKSVANFDIYEFSGSWYELAKMSEKNVTNKNIMINFSINGDKIKVVESFKKSDNSTDKKQYSATLVKDNNNTILEVMRIMPFKEKYSIAKIDGYEYTMLYGQDDLLILSRYKTIPEVMKVIYLDHAKKDGYDISKIKWITQE